MLRRWLIAAWLGWAVWGVQEVRAEPLAPQRLARTLSAVERDLARGRPGRAEIRLLAALARDGSNLQLALRYAEIALPCALPQGRRELAQRRRAARHLLALPEPRPATDETEGLKRRLALHRAWALSLRGAAEAALDQATQATRLQDLYAAGCLRPMAALFVQHGDLARAERALSLARSSVPQDMQVASDLGLVLLARGQANLALAPLSERFAVDPGDLTARRDLAYALAAAGRANEGYELLARVDAACRSETGCLLELARTALEAGLLPEARALAEELVARHPSQLDGLFLLAEAQLRAGDPQAAARSYERVLSLSPKHPRASEALRALTPGNAP